MKVTITFTNSMNKQQTGTFEIVRASDLSKEEGRNLISQGYTSIGGEDWDDEGFAQAEKWAALQCGITRGEKFLAKF